MEQFLLGDAVYGMSSRIPYALYTIFWTTDNLFQIGFRMYET